MHQEPVTMFWDADVGQIHISLASWVESHQTHLKGRIDTLSISTILFYLPTNTSEKKKNIPVLECAIYPTSCLYFFFTRISIRKLLGDIQLNCTIPISQENCQVPGPICQDSEEWLQRIFMSAPLAAAAIVSLRPTVSLFWYLCLGLEGLLRSHDCFCFQSIWGLILLLQNLVDGIRQICVFHFGGLMTHMLTVGDVDASMVHCSIKTQELKGMKYNRLLTQAFMN